MVLIDNGQLPVHKDITHLFSDVIFYDRFRRNKIILCSEIPQDIDEDDLLSKALSQLGRMPDETEGES